MLMLETCIRVWCDFMWNTHAVLVDVVARHTSDTKLVQSDVDWLASLAQAGTLHKRVSTTVLMDELACLTVRIDNEKSYLNISVGRKVHALADLSAVLLLRRYRQLVTSRIETKRLWIALWTR